MSQSGADLFDKIPGILHCITRTYTNHLKVVDFLSKRYLILLPSFFLLFPSHKIQLDIDCNVLQSKVISTLVFISIIWAIVSWTLFRCGCFLNLFLEFV